MKTRQIVVTRLGGPEVLSLVEQQLDEPSPGQVRVRIEVAGVSFADLLMREGLHPEPSPPPFVPGWDIVGTVDAVGEGVSAEWLGKRVVAMPIHGGYAQHICLPVADLTLVPEGLASEKVVSLVLNYITAYQMLHRVAHVREGQRILVHGAAGGVGTALVQLARLAGLETYGTAASTVHDVVAALGATPIDYRTKDFVREIRRLTGDGVDAVFDGVGEDNVWRSFRSLRPHGRVIVFGFTAFLPGGRMAEGIRFRFRGFVRPLWLALRAIFSPGHRRILPYSIQMLMRRHPDWFREDLARLLDLLAVGAIDPIVAARMPLSEARRAQEMLGSAQVRGKIVLDCA